MDEQPGAGLVGIGAQRQGLVSRSLIQPARMLADLVIAPCVEIGRV